MKFQKALCLLLAVVNATYPVVASARSYFYVTPMPKLKVVNGISLTSTNVDTTNTTSATVTLGQSVLRVAPSQINFGSVPATQASGIQTVTLYNLGEQSLTLGALSATFQFGVTNNCDGVSIPPLGSCQVNATFLPTQVGPTTGLLTIPFSSGGQTSSTQVTLSGSPTPPPAGVVRSGQFSGFLSTDGSRGYANGTAYINFPSAITNQQSWTQTFTLQSTGDAPLDYTGMSFVDNDGSFTSDSDCPAAIAPGSFCTISVTFAPTTKGSKMTTLYVNTSNYLGNSMPVTLAGEAYETYPVFGQASTASVDFGTLVQGNAAGSQVVTIANSGTAPLKVGTLSLEGTSTTGLSIASTTCTTAVPVNGTCAVTLALDTSALTTLVDARLVVPHDGRNTPASPVKIPVTGGVVAQTRTLAYATPLDWGNVDVSVATPKVLTVTNSGNSPVTGISAATTSPFSVATNACTGVTLQPGAHCDITFSLTYATNGAISRAATISATNLTTPAAALTLQANLYTRTIAALAPATLAFGLQTTQAWSSDENFITVTNTGNTTIKPFVNGRSTVDNTVSGAPWLRVSTDTCSAGVAPAATCKFGFQVKPTATSALSTTVTVYPDTGMSAGSKTATVTTTGTQQSYSLSTSALNFGAVGSNQYADQTITVTNTSPAGTAVTGFSGVAITNPTSPAGSGTVTVPSNTCTATLASQASCTMTVRYTGASYPSSTPTNVTGGSVAFYWTGARSTTTTLPVTASLVGTTLTASVSSPDFGDVPAGVSATSAARRVVTLTNTGSYPVTLSTVQFDSTNALSLAEDTAVAGRCVSAATLAAGASCTYTLYSTIPGNTAAGIRTTTFTPRVLGLNAVPTAVGTGMAFTGNVLPTTLSTSTNAVDFGTVGERTSVTKTFTFQTTHGGSGMLYGGTVTGAGYSVSFTGCAVNTYLNAGTMCTANVTFAPGAFTTATMTGNVALKFTIGGVATTLATVNFTGQVEQSAYTVDYNDLNWGDVPTQTPGNLRYAVIRNTSTSAVFPLSPVTNPATVATPFTVSKATATYTYNGTALSNCAQIAQLNAGASCYVGVSLSGATGASAGNGAFSGNVAYPTTSTVGNLTVPLTANFLSAAPTASDTTVTFPNPTPSSTTHVPDMTVTVTNSGSGRAYWTVPTGGNYQVATTGNFWIVKTDGSVVNAATPALVANSTRCIEMPYLEAGASCTVTLRFSPTGASGTKTGTLKLGTLTPVAQALTVNLTGTATAGLVYMNQSALDFGTQLVGSTNVQTLVIGNGGDTNLDIRNIQRLRADGYTAQYPTELTAAHDCPATLQPGQECHINVTFSPDRNLNWGALASKEVVQFQHYSNGAWTTVQVPLSGIGTGANLTASTHTHALGMVDRTVVPQDYLNTVTFTASGAAPVRILSFAPATLLYLETYAGGTCASNLTLQPGESCTVNIRNRADFTGYSLSPFSTTQQIMTINGTYYKDASTVMSDRSVQLVATGTVSTPPTLVEVSPRGVTTNVDNLVSIFGTNFRVGADVRLDGAPIAYTLASATEIRLTVPANQTVGTHTLTVKNTDGRAITLTGTFAVTTDSPSKDTSQQVYTAAYDHPVEYASTKMLSAVVLADGRKVAVDTAGLLTLYDANDRKLASTSVTGDGWPIKDIRLSVTGTTVQVGWISAYEDDGNLSCGGGCFYRYELFVNANLQTFTVGSNTLAATTGRYNTSLVSYANYVASYGTPNPALVRQLTVEGFDVARSGSDTVMAYSYSISSVGRTAAVRVWSGSNTPGAAYAMGIQTGSVLAVGTVFQGSNAYVRYGDRIYTYTAAGTTLSGGASYQYPSALPTDTAFGLGYSATTGELLTSCYGNSMICTITTNGEILSTLTPLAGSNGVLGYADGSYTSALFNIWHVGSSPAGLTVVQASTPQATRVVKR